MALEGGEVGGVRQVKKSISADAETSSRLRQGPTTNKDDGIVSSIS